MKKYRVQVTVSIEVAVEVKAESLEDALRMARALEKDDPISAGFVSIPRKADHLWNNETVLTGVIDA